MSNYGYPLSNRRDIEPRGRICVVDGCDTVLSRYNKTELCGIHTDDQPPQPETPIYRKGKGRPGNAS